MNNCIKEMKTSFGYAYLHVEHKVDIFGSDVVIGYMIEIDISDEEEAYFERFENLPDAHKTFLILSEL
ncbi:hypothetical protein [Providencia rettgeri]|uniref:hypothetical protein n=1 Tax=Providencia rettgeri TaxID=587 RepID=UPI0023617DF8|nr:hypothetical protein [Providencia rettgeri]